MLLLNSKQVKNTVLLLLIGITITVFSTACTNEKADVNHTIVLKWPKAYASEDWKKVKTGLAWSLSFLGAALPDGSVDACLIYDYNDRIFFDPSRAGFNDEALIKINQIIKQLKESEEYKVNSTIDLGRFLMLTVYSSWNYFAITGTEQTLDEFRNKFRTDTGIIFVATHSGISINERKITFSISNDISRMYFLAEEGTGSVESGNFVPLEYETITIMPNGQPKFTLYDKNGRLKAAADTSLSIAGKPGKCMWCHESTILPLYTAGTDVPGYITQTQFIEYTETARDILHHFRKSLQTDITYTNTEDHAFSEFLYLSFMEPSVSRLSKEWQMSETDVTQILSVLTTHTNAEVPFLGQLFERHSVEPFAPFNSLPVPSSAREKSAYEPDFFNLSH